MWKHKSTAAQDVQTVVEEQRQTQQLLKEASASLKKFYAKEAPARVWCLSEAEGETPDREAIFLLKMFRRLHSSKQKRALATSRSSRRCYRSSQSHSTWLSEGNGVVALHKILDAG